MVPTSPENESMSTNEINGFKRLHIACLLSGNKMNLILNINSLAIFCLLFEDIAKTFMKDKKDSCTL